MKILLKQDWDFPSSYESNSGHFIGREKEKNQLVDEFLRKNSGSILISGARGVGKTALVYASLQEVCKKNEKIIPVIINASQLELYIDQGKDQNINNLPELILRNLIRRLYGYFQSGNKKIIGDELMEKLGNLYRKAVSKEVEIISKQYSCVNDVNENENTTTLGKEVEIDEKHIISFISLIIGVIILFSPEFYSKYVNYVLATITFVFPYIKLSFFKKIVKTLKTKKEHLYSAEEIYKQDNSLSNLEQEFNELLKECYKNEIKIIFVIDELDKIQKEGDGAEQIFSIIKTYKNLFTLSFAQFVFITSDDAYYKIVDGKKKKEQNYTLFTNRIFLTRPDYKDLERFIEDIINKIEINDEIIENDFLNRIKDDNLLKFKVFKNFLCFKARSDYFELYLTIRDYISSYKEMDGKVYPVIDVGDFKFDERLCGKIQKVIGQIFALNYKREQSEWHNNDKMLSDLYDFMADNYNKIFTLENRNEVIINFLIPYLERLRIIMKAEEQDDSDDSWIRFQWTGNIPGEGNVEDIKSAIGMLFKDEENFLKLGTKYVSQINDIDDITSKITDNEDWSDCEEIVQGKDGEKFTGINAFNIFSKYKPYVDGLSKPYPENIETDTLKKLITEISSEIEKIRLASFKIFTGITKDVLMNKSIGFTEQQLQNDPELFNIFNTFRSQLSSNGNQHTVFYLNNPIKSKQCLITHNVPPNLLDSELIKSLYDNKSYRIYNIQTDKKLNYDGINQITVDKLEYYLPEGRKKKKRKTVQEKKVVNNFINIVSEGNYRSLAESIKEIYSWFSQA